MRQMVTTVRVQFDGPEVRIHQYDILSSRKCKVEAGLEVIGHWFHHSCCRMMTVYSVCTVASVSKAKSKPEQRAALRPIKPASECRFRPTFITVVFFHGFQLSVRSLRTYGKIQTHFQIQYKGNYIPHSGIRCNLLVTLLLQLEFI